MLRPEEPHGPRHVDALLLDPPSADVSALLEQARDAGVPAVTYLDGMSSEIGIGPRGLPDAARTVEGPGDEAGGQGAAAAAGAGHGDPPREVTVGPGAAGGPWRRPVVDTGRVNPIGVRWGASGPLAVCAIDPGRRWRDGLEALRAATGDAPLAAVVRAGTPEGELAEVLGAGPVAARPSNAGAGSSMAAPEASGVTDPSDDDGGPARETSGPTATVGGAADEIEPTIGTPEHDRGADPTRDLAFVRVPQDLARLVAALRSHTGVVDHPDLHPAAASRAEWLALLGCAGVPVVAFGLDEEVTSRLGPGFVDALRAASVEELATPGGRDRLGVVQRREALREHGAEGAWRSISAHFDLTPARAPSVSVVLATNRPEHLLAAVARFAAFRYPTRELVVALHGDGFEGRVDHSMLATATGGERGSPPVTIRHVPARRTLGEALNAAVEAASGDLVTKLDDDDLYDVDHLDDLVEALRYSGATLVGKGSEFVHLGEIDLTIRRLPKGAESNSRTIAGGTLMIGRDDLRRVGGWQRAPRSVDQLLMDDVLEAGGRIHRTHPYGFVLNRHGRGHTWDTPTDYFLRQAVDQWSGLALDAAGFRAPDAGAGSA